MCYVYVCMCRCVISEVVCADVLTVRLYVQECDCLCRYVRCVVVCTAVLCVAVFAGVWNSKQAERAKLKAVDVNQDQSLVAMGNSLGILSLFRYPCAKDLVRRAGYRYRRPYRFFPGNFGSYRFLVPVYRAVSYSESC